MKIIICDVANQLSCFLSRTIVDYQKSALFLIGHEHMDMITDCHQQTRFQFFEIVHITTKENNILAPERQMLRHKNESYRVYKKENISISGHRPVPQDSNERIGLAPSLVSHIQAQASCRRSSDSRPGALPQEMEDD